MRVLRSMETGLESLHADVMRGRGWYRVDAVSPQRMTAREAAHTKPHTLRCAVNADGLCHVIGAGRVEPAATCK